MSKSTGNFLTLSQSVEKYGADVTRFNLADAGDTVEDANFVEINANATILRLHGMIDWTKEMIESRDRLRQGPFTYHDKVFESKINQTIVETEKHYDAFLFREALKTGVFEFQAMRDTYREVTAFSGGMHQKLVFRFIEIQALLLAPISPHICEHMWSLLGKEGNIVTAPWPAANPVDEVLLKSFDFVLDCACTLRHRIRTLTEKKKGSERPRYADLYIAESYPPWQKAILTCLQEAYNDTTKTFPDNKEIVAKLRNYPDVKKFMKKAMPFAQLVKGNVAEKGIRAMDLTTPFDQKEVLKENLTYLEKSLDLIGVRLLPASQGDLQAQEEASPGKPHLVLHAKDPQPHAVIEFRNPQPTCPHFTLHVSIHDGETVEEVKKRIKDLDGNLTDAQQVTVLRYKNPAVSPRTVPEFERWDLDTTSLVNEDKFHLTEQGGVTISCQQAKDVAVGDVMLYVVSPDK